MDKNILKSNPSLVIKNKNETIYRNENIQSLYLYPLSIVDYINNLCTKKPILLNIINLNMKLDYKKILSNSLFENLLCIEFLIENNITAEYLIKVKEIIDYAISRGIKITLNIKNVVLINENFIINTINLIDYIKCFYKNKSLSYYKEFLKKIKLINKYKNPKSLFHIKSYLDELDVNNYEKRIIDFSNFGVDIYQVSKELLPIGKSNKSFSTSKSLEIRRLEKIYSDYKYIKFISVRDLSFLYYPRFELDNRNCKQCSACMLKPYLYDNYILPCKVNKVMNNMDKWGVTLYKNLNKFSYYGRECDDCASIFENDFLGFIKENYLNSKYEYNIICGDNND